MGEAAGEASRIQAGDLSNFNSSHRLSADHEHLSQAVLA
jgi:hypothetical protein